MPPMSNAEKVRENLARRRLKRRGLELHKSRIRDRKAIGFGYFTILDSRERVVVVLPNIEQVEAWLDAD